MYSQRTAVENDSNQSEPLIGPTPPPNWIRHWHRQAGRQAGRQVGEDRYQNQTTAVRTTSQRTLRTIQSIDRSNWTRASISARHQIESRPPREAPQTTTVRMYSQRTAIENDSNQSEPLIGPTPSPNWIRHWHRRAGRQAGRQAGR